MSRCTLVTLAREPKECRKSTISLHYHSAMLLSSDYDILLSTVVQDILPHRTANERYRWPADRKMRCLLSGPEATGCVREGFATPGTLEYASSSCLS